MLTRAGEGPVVGSQHPAAWPCCGLASCLPRKRLPEGHLPQKLLRHHPQHEMALEEEKDLAEQGASSPAASTSQAPQAMPLDAPEDPNGSVSPDSTGHEFSFQALPAASNRHCNT